jgi:hypothetical protein
MISLTTSSTTDPCSSTVSKLHDEENPKKVPRARKANFSMLEESILQREVENNFDVLRDKHSNSVTNLKTLFDASEACCVLHHGNYFLHGGSWFFRSRISTCHICFPPVFRESGFGL